MNKKEFNKIMKVAAKEFDEEKNERIKTLIKGRLREYELAKATVKKIEKQMKQLQNKEFDETELFLEYDEQ